MCIYYTYTHVGGWDMSLLYNKDAPKRATNLTVNMDLLAKAKEMNLNISSILEKALIEVLKQKKRESWLTENTEAISAYNKHIEENGLFSDEMRTF
jgi:antitoxin CcdA